MRDYNARLQDMASHDPLTQVLNARAYYASCEQQIAQSQRSQQPFSVLFVDLDRFKEVNDTLGHDTGDELLQEVAVALRDMVRATDHVIRLGGDEFLVLLEEVGSAQNAARVAAKLLHSLGQPHDIEGHSLHCSGSIGVAMYPDDGDSADELIKHADAAMFDSKGDGRNQVHFFSEESWERLARRFTLEAELRTAIEEKQFIIHYQPQVELAGNRISGAEALIRWKHPVRGIVPPLEFIPLAEELGLILDVDPGKVSGAGLTQARPPGSIIPQDPFSPADTAAVTDTASIASQQDAADSSDNSQAGSQAADPTGSGAP